MATADIIDIQELRRNQPSLFRDRHDDAPLPAPSPIAAAVAPPDFGAYAPDPDADYRHGLVDGRDEALAEQLLHVIRPRRWSRREKVALFFIQVGLPIALLLFLFWNGRS